MIYFDDFCYKIVSYLPSRLLYWSIIQAMAETMELDEEETEISVDEILTRYKKKHAIKTRYDIKWKA